MSAERSVDPELQQALEKVQDTLRAEREALGELPRENARLRERLERLQAERDSLHRELKVFQKGRPAKAPRLPESLSPPFELRAPGGLRQYRREFVAALVLGGILLEMPWSVMKPVQMLAMLALMGMVAVPLLWAWRRHSRVRFGVSDMEVVGRDGTRHSAAYADVLEAEVNLSSSQRLRGVGTVVVTCKPGEGELEGKPLILKDVPEPERLAEWIRSRRSLGG